MSVRRTMVAALAAMSLLGVGLVSSATALAAEALEAPATPTSEAVTATTAKLKGELNPGAGAAASEFHFLYTPGTSATACEGAAAPEPAGTGVGNHHAVGPQEITGLQPNTEYAFCLQAFNVTETLSSTVATFKTQAVKPTVSSQSASGLTPFDAVLEAVVNPNYDETTIEFKYATNEALTANVGTVAGTSINGGEQGTSADVGGTLTGGTTYYFEVIAKNSKGEAEVSAPATFTTPAAEVPVVEGQISSGVTSTTATLEGQINPNYQETTYEFEYATNEALVGATKVGAGVLPPAIFGNQPVSVALSGLTGNTVYYYRLTATDRTGTTDGTPVQSFQTTDAPLPTTGASSYITRTSAILAGAVDPAGSLTQYHFVYGTTGSYGHSTAAVTVGEGFAAVAASQALEELQPGTTYHYALVAANLYGTTTGADHTFTTSPPTPPTAATGGAVGVGQETATITGGVEPNGLQTTYEFQLGTEAGNYSAEGYGGVGGSGAQGVSVGLQNLAPGTTYHYRIVAKNADGSSYGVDQTFTTGSYPNPLASIPVSPAVIAVAPEVTPVPKVTTPSKPKKPKKAAKHKKKKKKSKKKK
jgi:hypothetical protein